FDARLVNGPNRCSGRVELLHNQEWGTVCDASWDIYDAQVVCRELGCGNALKAFRGAHHGQGFGPIWIEGVNCTGKEASLSECNRSPWGEHHCSHSQDATGVVCSDFYNLQQKSLKSTSLKNWIFKGEMLVLGKTESPSTQPYNPEYQGRTSHNIYFELGVHPDST
uniref:SRCR domain-containing protein n=1 Tax=Anolis carolinensis TaxID=28377 RepID=A0A803SKX0_ANOCA